MLALTAPLSLRSSSRLPTWFRPSDPRPTFIARCETIKYGVSRCVLLDHVLPVYVVGDVDRLFCTSCSSNAVCAHSVAVKVWDVEIFSCKQGIGEKDGESDDDGCIALHDQDLSDAEWQIVEVSAFFCAAITLKRMAFWAGIIAHFPTFSRDLEAARG